MASCGHIPFISLLESESESRATSPGSAGGSDGESRPPSVISYARCGSSGAFGPPRSASPKASPAPNSDDQPRPAHRWTCDEAITTVAYHENLLFAGTVSGDLITVNLETYQEVYREAAHSSSILTLLCSGGLLFSGSADSLVKVWVPGPEPLFKHTVYMLSDIGDIFSLAYWPERSLLYIGTQNASLHWVRLDEESLAAWQPQVNKTKMPAVRPNRFFDSHGPGGKLAPQQHETRKIIEASEVADSAFELVEVPLDNQIAFAHYSAIFAMIVDTKRRILVTGSGDGVVKFWSIANAGQPQPSALSRSHLGSPTNSSHFSPLSAALGQPVLTQELTVGDSVFSMAVASSWQLCCGLDTNRIILVDLDTLQVLRHEIPQTRGPLLALAATEDRIFVSSQDTITALDTTSAEVCVWKNTGCVTALITLPKQFSAGQLVSAGSDGSVILWNVSVYETPAEAPILSTGAAGATGVTPTGATSTGATPTTATGASSTTSTVTTSTAAASATSSAISPTAPSSAPPTASAPQIANLKIEPLGNDAMIQFLAKIVHCQTVSGRDRQHWSDSRRCATLLRDQVRMMGGSADLIRVEEGNPIVMCEFKATSTVQPSSPQSCSPSHSRIMFYGHYDVIEAQRDDVKWDMPPFQLTSINGYLYGRGVTDDKGPCTAALFAVARLHAEKRLNSDVVFLIEGEEESGSFGFLETVEKVREKIGKIDWIIFSNSLWLDDFRPCLNYGLRGVIFVEIEVTSGKGDVHSGVDGGLFREPAKDMINLLAKLTDDSTGEIAIPGFFDSVLPVTDAEEQLYEDIVSTTSTPRDDLIHKWRYPSLTVHKFEVSGPHNQTVIPANVRAYISLRLVPSQTAEGITAKMRSYLNEKFAKFMSPNQLSIRVKYEADPWLGDPTNRLFTLMRDSVEKVWGEPPLFIREGGSIPVARALEKMFEAPAAQLPCGQSSDGAHLNNERMRTTNMFNARKVFEEVFENLGLQK